MRDEKIRIRLIYNSPLGFLIRQTIAILLLILISYQAYLGVFPKIPLFFLSLLIIVEIFIKFELEVVKPSLLVTDNTGDILDSFTKEALESVDNKKSTKQFINYILKFPQVKFMLQKAVLSKENIKDAGISRHDLNMKAFEIAKISNGKYVTTSDLLSAYLLLTEEKTKALFTNRLKEEDILNINSWARVQYDEENPKTRRVRFVGIGFGETLVWGWTPETKNFTRDLTFSTISRHTLIEGREAEYKNLLEVMEKNQNNNVLLVGEIGTGKSNLVNNFIYESYEAVLSKKLNHRRFLELSVGPLVAGASNRAELETRLQSIIEEVRHSGNIVLFIPQFQNLLGSTSYDIDLSGAILPYLKDGHMPIIATMTPGEYKKFFETSALREVFEVIKLEEPNPDVSLKMLFQKTEEIEREAEVYISYKAVTTAVKYADKYEVSGALPGSGVSLLKDSAATVKSARGKWAVVAEEDILSKVEDKSHIPVGVPNEPEKKVLLNLESEMHKYIVGQDEAVITISEAMRRVRAGLTREKPISFLFLGPTGVGKTETAKTLAKLYFEGETHIIRLDMSEYGSEESLPRLIGSSSGSFMDQVYTHPFSLILLDEFEKADPKILNLFLQVFDDGRLTDENGRTVSFNNTIIIATSNAGSELIRESLETRTPLTNKTLLDFLQKNAIFSPELLNRFDDVVIFKPLTPDQILEITKMVLTEFAHKMKVQDITLNFDPQATQKIAKDGYSPEFGARPLRRYIESSIEDSIAKKLLTDELKRGDKVFVSLDGSSNFTFFKAS